MNDIYLRFNLRTNMKTLEKALDSLRLVQNPEAHGNNFANLQSNTVVLHLDYCIEQKGIFEA